MADTTTTNYGFTKPEVGASQDSWGTKLNGNWDDVDADLKDLEDTKAEKATTISAGTGLTGGGDLSANRTVTLADTAVTPGTYSPANVTVDQQGRVTSASTATINNANWSGAQLAVINGGTGAASAAGALVNLGLTATAAELNTLDGITATVTELNYTDGVTSNIQTQLNNKQPLDADLTALGALSKTDGNFIVGNGSTWVAESGSTARSSLGLGALATANSVGASTIDDNSVGAAELNVSGNGTSGQYLRSDGDGSFTWATPSEFQWNVTDVNTSFTASGYTYTLPSNAIAVSVHIYTYMGGNTGARTDVQIKNGSTVLSTVKLGGGNEISGTDGGSGMSDSFHAFIPVPSNATNLYFYRATGGRDASGVIEQVVKKA